MKPRRSRLTAILLLGLVVALGITALTGKNAPVLIWFAVIGISFVVEIGREWSVVIKPSRSIQRTPFHILSFLLGSYPYAAAMIVMAIFTYYVLMLLLGHTIDPQQSRILGKVVVFALAPIFFGGFFIYILGFAMNLIRGRKREPIIDRPKRKATSADATQPRHVGAGPERRKPPSPPD